MTTKSGCCLSLKALILFALLSCGDKTNAQTYQFLILPTDRSRADLDWSKGQLTWRYRNRLTFERRVTIGFYHPAPYLSAEVFYQSQYQKWSTTALYAGCLLPAGKHFELNPYYEHQNITGTAPNRQLNQFGLILAVSY